MTDPCPPTLLTIDVAQRQTTLAIDEAQWQAWLTDLFRGEGFEVGDISVAVVDDTEMHRLNREYLQHDYPTDVLSFVLHAEDGCLEGEIIVNAEMAVRCGPEFGGSAEDELALYLIHGALHLVGYQDKAPADSTAMRAREAYYLDRFGIRASHDTQGNLPGAMPT